MSIDKGARLSEASVGVFMSWWELISKDDAAGTARADRAILRRAPDLTAVACTSAYQRLHERMKAANAGADWPVFRNDRIAAAVALSAHVQQDSRRLTLPKAMSASTETGDSADDSNPVSELRFKRLLDAPDIDALFIGLRRVMPLIAERVNPKSLLLDLFEWGDTTKKRWAYDYAWPTKSGD